MARPKTEASDGLDKFKRYRERQRRKGMKLLRLWAPDPRRPDFSAEAKREGMLLRGQPEEKEALDFIEAAIDWPES